MTMTQTFTIRQAAEFYQCHPNTIRKAIRADKLHPLAESRFVGAYILAADDLAKWDAMRSNKDRFPMAAKWSDAIDDVITIAEKGNDK